MVATARWKSELSAAESLQGEGKEPDKVKRAARAIPRRVRREDDRGKRKQQGPVRLMRAVALVVGLEAGSKLKVRLSAE